MSEATVAAGELRQFIEQVEELEGERADRAVSIREIFNEAKARGYDVKVMKKVIARRKRSREELQEEDAILQLYLEALDGR